MLLTIAAVTFIFLAMIGLILALRTLRGVRQLEAAFPPLGRIVKIEDAGRPRDVHIVDVPGNPALLPVVFIHGASGNLCDQVGAFSEAIARLPHHRRFRSIYLDRPGCGYTQRRRADASPRAQADMIAATLDALGIEKAIVCGHSFGGGVAVTMAVEHSDRVAALSLLAPAAYPWPGQLNWPYRMASLPVIRTICAWTIVMPLGMRLMPAGIAGIFHPDPVPDSYETEAAIGLLFRPANFLANAADILAIKARAAEISPSFRKIDCPTWIMQGRADRVVRSTIHAVGLYRAIRGARLETHDDLGHKPDYVLRERIVDELADFARGEPVSNQGFAQAAE